MCGRGLIGLSVYYVGSIPYSDELYHHGVRGMHWGIRKEKYKEAANKTSTRNKDQLSSENKKNKASEKTFQKTSYGKKHS